jgi:putative ABC transport system substrate-binding protein
MTNKDFTASSRVWLSVACLICLIVLGCSTGPEKTKPRNGSDIGLVQLVDSPLMAEARRGLEDALTEGLRADGKWARLDWAAADGEPLALKPIIQAFEEEGKQIIVTLGSPPLEHAIAVVAETPVVFGVTINPGVLGINLQYRLSMPNFTGTYGEPPLEGLGEFVKMLMPNIKEVGIVWNPSRINSRYEMHALRKWCAKEGLLLEEARIRRMTDLDYATRLLLDKQPEAIFILADDLVIQGFHDHMAPLIKAEGIPIFTDMPDLVGEGGADLGWGFDFYAWGRATGRKVLAVLSGTTPHQVPVDRFEQCRLAIHQAGLESARLQVPPELLQEADVTN